MIYKKQKIDPVCGEKSGSTTDSSPLTLMGFPPLSSYLSRMKALHPILNVRSVGV